MSTSDQQIANIRKAQEAKDKKIIAICKQQEANFRCDMEKDLDERAKCLKILKSWM